MKMLRSAGALSLAAALAVVTAAPASAQNSNYGEDQKDIVETAIAAGSFNTLAQALQAADLVNVLKGDGPCNRERLRTRVKAWDDGAWVRDAAAADAP